MLSWTEKPTRTEYRGAGGRIKISDNIQVDLKANTYPKPDLYAFVCEFLHDFSDSIGVRAAVGREAGEALLRRWRAKIRLVE